MKLSLSTVILPLIIRKISTGGYIFFSSKLTNRMKMIFNVVEILKLQSCFVIMSLI